MPKNQRFQHLLLFGLYTQYIYKAWALKSASAPPRGGAQELSSYYWCSIWIVLIDYQSKRKDVCMAAQRLRSNVVVIVWKFFIGGWALTKSLNTATTSLTYIFGSFELIAFIPPAFSLPFINILYNVVYIHIQYACNPLLF